MPEILLRMIQIEERKLSGKISCTLTTFFGEKATRKMCFTGCRDKEYDAAVEKCNERRRRREERQQQEQN